MNTSIIAVIRRYHSVTILKVTKPLAQGRVSIVEITMTTPKAVQVIYEVTDSHQNDVVIGVGTDLDAEKAGDMIMAGAESIVSTTLNPEVICMTKRYGKAVMPGAFTSTEILQV